MVPEVGKQLLIGLFVTLMTVSLNSAGVTGISHKRFIIHVPMKMKTHHHTHTIYTHIHGGGKVEYKILGYTQKLNGHSGIPAHGMGKLASDIVFNHYARNGDNQLQDESLSDYEDWDF